jgi:type IV secretory pathway VirB3-like protein
VAAQLVVSRVVLSSTELVMKQSACTLHSVQILQFPDHKQIHLVRFVVFTAMTMKNGIFWDVTPCGSCKIKRFGGT